MILLALQVLALTSSPSAHADFPGSYRIERLRDGNTFRFQAPFDVNGATVERMDTESTAYFEHATRADRSDRTQCAVTWMNRHGIPHGEYTLANVWMDDELTTPNITFTATRGTGESKREVLIECFLRGDSEDATLGRIQATLRGNPAFNRTPVLPVTAEPAAPSASQGAVPPSVDEVFPVDKTEP